MRNSKIILLVAWLTASLALPAVSSAPAASTNYKPQRVGSYTKLLKLIQGHQPRYFAGYRTGLGAMAMNAPAGPAVVGNGSGSVTASTTLTQVVGVDEGDEAANNGTLICQINQGRVLILQAYPDSEAAVLSTLDFTMAVFSPSNFISIAINW